MGKASGGSSSRGDLMEALWDASDLAMQGSWENLALALGNPLPLPLEPLPFQELAAPQLSSSSSLERRLLVRTGSALPRSIAMSLVFL